MVLLTSKKIRVPSILVIVCSFLLQLIFSSPRAADAVLKKHSSSPPSLQRHRRGQSQLAGTCSLFASNQQEVNGFQVKHVRFGSSESLTCECNLEHVDIAWKLRDSPIPGSLVDISSYNSSTRSLRVSEITVKKFAKDMEGILCCSQSISAPSCVTLLVDQSPPPVVSIDTFLPATNVAASGDARTVTVSCGFLAYGDFYSHGYMVVSINDVGSLSYDPNPIIRNETKSGVAVWRMLFRMNETVREDDVLQCGWIPVAGDTDRFVSQSVVIKFKIQTPQAFPSSNLVYTTIPTSRPLATTSSTFSSFVKSTHGTISTNDRDVTSTEVQSDEQQVAAIIIVAPVVVAGILLVTLLVLLGLWMRRRYKSTRSRVPTACSNEVQCRRRWSFKAKKTEIRRIIDDWPTDLEQINELACRQNMLDLSRSLGDSWWMLGLRLGLSYACLENIVYKHPRSQEDQGFEMLLQWTRRQEATKSKLCQAVEQLHTYETCHAFLTQE
ncbi:uncharacterized protein LOC134186784 isoform X2 [Corticium candelabrum]|uniref:uncharacterized protein LOC134186784 isoform X2 n=1 Tax=Corticium candelabrum TaxID=121492 RepID=UPI002E269DCE|nr:uncharacterized protein LOC134186784 isoform X2 [Corticium candelabrum]